MGIEFIKSKSSRIFEGKNFIVSELSKKFNLNNLFNILLNFYDEKSCFLILMFIVTPLNMISSEFFLQFIKIKKIHTLFSCNYFVKIYHFKSLLSISVFSHATQNCFYKYLFSNLCIGNFQSRTKDVINQF